VLHAHYLFLFICITWRILLRCTNHEALLYAVFSMFLFCFPRKANTPSINRSGVAAASRGSTASELILRKSSLLSSSRLFLDDGKGDRSRNINSVTVKLTDEAASPRKIFLIPSAVYCLNYILFSQHFFIELHQSMSFS